MMISKKPDKEKAKGLVFNVFKGLIFNGFIIGIIVTALIENKTNLFSEILFPRTFLKVDEDYLSSNPQVQIIGDLPNHSTAAMFNESVDIMLKLENDNSSSILINSIDLIVQDYTVLPESDYLVLRDHYSPGEMDEIYLGTTQPINPKKRKYSLKVLDSDTKIIDLSKHLQIESTWTDIYRFNLKIEDEGLYNLMFEANYTIHGTKRTARSNNVKLLYKPFDIKEHVNNTSDDLKDYLVAYNEEPETGDYFLYGNGDFFVDKDGIYTDRFDLYSYLIKRIYIEEGTTTLTKYHLPSVYIKKENDLENDLFNDLEIYLPSTINKIEENAFDDYPDWDFFSGDFLYCTIIYDGTEEQWNSIEIGDNNEALEKCTIQYNPN